MPLPASRSIKYPWFIAAGSRRAFRLPARVEKRLKGCEVTPAAGALGWQAGAGMGGSRCR